MDADTALKRKAKTSGIVRLGAGKLPNIAAVPLSGGSCVSFATVYTFRETLNCCRVYYFSFRSTRLGKKEKKHQVHMLGFADAEGEMERSQEGTRMEGGERSCLNQRSVVFESATGQWRLQPLKQLPWQIPD